MLPAITLLRPEGGRGCNYVNYQTRNLLSAIHNVFVNLRLVQVERNLKLRFAYKYILYISVLSYKHPSW